MSDNIRPKLILNHPAIGTIAIELFVKPRSIRLSCVYVPPNCDDFYHQDVFTYINTQPTTDDLDIILLGVFNAPDANWSTPKASNSFSRTLCNALSKKQSDPVGN